MKLMKNEEKMCSVCRTLRTFLSAGCQLINVVKEAQKGAGKERWEIWNLFSKQKIGQKEVTNERSTWSSEFGDSAVKDVKRNVECWKIKSLNRGKSSTSELVSNRPLSLSATNCITQFEQYSHTHSVIHCWSSSALIKFLSLCCSFTKKRIVLSKHGNGQSGSCPCSTVCTFCFVSCWSQLWMSPHYCSSWLLSHTHVMETSYCLHSVSTGKLAKWQLEANCSEGKRKGKRAKQGWGLSGEIPSAQSVTRPGWQCANWLLIKSILYALINVWPRSVCVCVDVAQMMMAVKGERNSNETQSQMMMMMMLVMRGKVRQMNAGEDCEIARWN